MAHREPSTLKLRAETCRLCACSSFIDYIPLVADLKGETALYPSVGIKKD